MIYFGCCGEVLNWRTLWCINLILTHVCRQTATKMASVTCVTMAVTGNCVCMPTDAQLVIHCSWADDEEIRCSSTDLVFLCNNSLEDVVLLQLCARLASCSLSIYYLK